MSLAQIIIGTSYDGSSKPEYLGLKLFVPFLAVNTPYICGKRFNGITVVICKQHGRKAPVRLSFYKHRQYMLPAMESDKRLYFLTYPI